MPSEVAAALIALGGVALSALITIVFNAMQTRFHYKQLFAQTVSSNRMDWINVWRESISKFLACAELLILHSPKCQGKERCEPCKLIMYKKEFYESRGMITSRLNMNEELHVLMFAAVNRIDIEAPDEDFVAKREYILELERKILKIEWERVKSEARGKRR